MSNSFIHLHLHSEYSISDSLIRIEELIDHVSRNKSPAVAITDNNNIGKERRLIFDFQIGYFLLVLHMLYSYGRRSDSFCDAFKE